MAPIAELPVQTSIHAAAEQALDTALDIAVAEMDPEDVPSLEMTVDGLYEEIVLNIIHHRSIDLNRDDPQAGVRLAATAVVDALVNSRWALTLTEHDHRGRTRAVLAGEFDSASDAFVEGVHRLLSGPVSRGTLVQLLTDEQADENWPVRLDLHSH